MNRAPFVLVVFALGFLAGEIVGAWAYHTGLMRAIERHIEQQEGKQ